VRMRIVLMVRCNKGGGGSAGWREICRCPLPTKKANLAYYSHDLKKEAIKGLMESPTIDSTTNSTINSTIPKKKGRPKGSVKLTLQRVANNPELLKTDGDKLKELKGLLISSRGKDVVEKALEIAMNDEHPHQGAMIKLCMDRLLPVSLFEKDKAQRSAVTIRITGIGDVDVNNEKPIADIEDAQYTMKK